MANQSDLIVVASARAKPGKEKDLAQALREVARPTRAQPGCIAFSLHRSADDPAVIIGIERWASKADHDKHLQGPHFQKLGNAMAGLIAEPPQIVWYDIMDEA
jgi:quinol monooxygenase YgiN